MSTEIIASLIGLVGIIVGALPTYVLMRQKTAAEVIKLEAETASILAKTKGIAEEKAQERYQSIKTAYNLLLVPGYDISLIVNILEAYEREGRVDAATIAAVRNITAATIDNIEQAMLSQDLIKRRGSYYQLTKTGAELLHDLRKYLQLT